MFIFSAYFSTEQFSCSFLSFSLKNMDSNICPCFVSFIWTQQTHRSLNISGFRYWCTASSLSWQVYWLHCMHGKSLAVTQVLIVRQRCVCLWYYKDAEMCNVNRRCKADCKSSREIIMVTVYDAFLFANISRQTLRSWEVTSTQTTKGNRLQLETVSFFWFHRSFQFPGKVGLLTQFDSESPEIWVKY